MLCLCSACERLSICGFSGVIARSAICLSYGLRMQTVHCLHLHYMFNLKFLGIPNRVGNMLEYNISRDCYSSLEVETSSPKIFNSARTPYLWWWRLTSQTYSGGWWIYRDIKAYGLRHWGPSALQVSGNTSLPWWFRGCIARSYVTYTCNSGPFLKFTTTTYSTRACRKGRE